MKQIQHTMARQRIKTTDLKMSLKFDLEGFLLLYLKYCQDGHGVTSHCPWPWEHWFPSEVRKPGFGELWLWLGWIPRILN